MKIEKYKEVALEDLASYHIENHILVVTATDLETNYLHASLQPVPTFEQIVFFYAGKHTYYFGQFGKYLIVHVQCSMGSMSRSGSIMTISTTLSYFKFRAVIMIGIAFGVDETKQKIGDVLVSQSVIPYNLKRIGEKEIRQRGIESPSSAVLLDRFTNLKQRWSYILREGTEAQVIPARLLSGEELIDNLEYRNELIKANPESKGGEMEGAGVYAACDGKSDWILVKGICDFGDGEKSKNKFDNQTEAIKAALSLSELIFNSDTALLELGLQPYENIIIVQPTALNDLLFDFYDLSKELYYIKRNVDEEFNRLLTQYCVWVYGPSGCGKSNLIVRNLINSNAEFIQINLAPYIGQSVEDFFKEILYELSSKVEGVTSVLQPKSFSDCNRSLLALFEKYYKGKELIVFIEEIPISTDEEHQEFAEKLFSLIISKVFVNGLNRIRFVLSSIENPVPCIKGGQHKIHQQVAFFELQNWISNDLKTLIDLIVSGLGIKISEEFLLKLIVSANGSPRFVKKFFRSIATLEKYDDNTLEFILKDTERDLRMF